MSVDATIDATISREGIYVNDPLDSGGETKYGITKAEARANGYNGPMKDLTREEAKRIYKFEYWFRPGLDRIDRISPKVAEELFDTGVNMGRKRAATFLQVALNCLNDRQRLWKDIEEDGSIGGQTIGALTALVKHRGKDGLKELLKVLEGLQVEGYVSLVRRREKDERFFYGWIAKRVGTFCG